MTLDKRMLYGFVAGLAVAWWMGSSSPVPFAPPPANNRPVMRFIAKAAKNALWFMLIAEPAPETTETRMVQTVVGEDGYPTIDHARAF